MDEINLSTTCITELMKCMMKEEVLYHSEMFLM